MVFPKRRDLIKIIVDAFGLKYKHFLMSQLNVYALEIV